MLIPMRKATLIALKQDRERLLLALQRCGELMVIQPDNGQAVDCGVTREDEVQRIGSVLAFLARYEKKKQLFAPRASIRYDQLIQEEQESSALTAEAELIAQQMQAARADAAARETQAQALQPWEALDVALENIRSTAHTRCFAGYVPEAQLDGLRAALEQAGARLQALGSGSEGTAVFVLCHRDDDAATRECLKASGFTEAVFPRLKGTPAQARSALLQEAQNARDLAEDLEKQAAALSLRQHEVKALFERRKAEQERNAQPVVQSNSAFCLQGWVRADRQDEVSRAVAEAAGVYELRFEEPAEGEMPPTVVHNAQLVTPFEAVTDLYSRPHPFGYDPNTAMAIFYFIFFGMMMSDAGYGIVTTLLLFVYQRLLKPRGTMGKLVGVLLFGSISTILWGFAFGGLFGLSLPPLLFNPMNEPLTMLLLCYGLGVVHLFAGMCIKMRLLFKAGDWQGAVFDQLSWMVLICGCILLALPATSAVGKVLAIAGAATILLMAGRDKKNIFARLSGGLMSLYGITSYLSDILSYSRIFALGLATGVIGMVINTIAGMLTQGGGVVGALGFVAAIFVLAGGHLFNIVINMLGAFVHTARLQYIEFYGKFYEAGGTEFKPLAIRPKYLDVVR